MCFPLIRSDGEGSTWCPTVIAWNCIPPWRTGSVRARRRSDGLAPNVEWDEIATKSDLRVLRADLRGEMSELRTALKGEIGELRTELKGEMAGLRTELKGEMAQLRNEFVDFRGQHLGVAKVRTELAELGARVNSQLPKLIAANIGSMLGVAGLVLAAAKLA